MYAWKAFCKSICASSLFFETKVEMSTETLKQRLSSIGYRNTRAWDYVLDAMSEEVKESLLDQLLQP
jgi:hypothetical protein